MHDIKSKKINSMKNFKYIKNIFSQHFFSSRQRFTLFFSPQCLFIISRTLLTLFLLMTALHTTQSETFANEATVIKVDVEQSISKQRTNSLNLQEDTPKTLDTKKEQKQEIGTNNLESTKNIQTNESPNSVRQNEFGWIKYFKAIGTMLFLLVLLWYVLKIVRKYGDGRFLPTQKLLPKDSMYIEGQLSLGPNKCITIVKVLDKHLVLGITEKNITLLTEMTEMVKNEETEHKKSFHEHIQNAATNNSAPSSDSSQSSTK